LIAAIALLATLGACKRDRTGTAGGVIDTARLNMSPDSAPLFAPESVSPGYAPATDKSSPAIVGFAATASDGEIMLGKLAVTKATNPEVKSFAQMMVDDHTKMLADTKALAAKLGIMLDTAAADARRLAGRAREEMRELTEERPGKDWDEDYMEAMVEGHQRVLTRLQDAAKAANPGELRTALEAAAAKVQAHLNRARELKDKIDD
jgi:putative membrane protein